MASCLLIAIISPNSNNGMCNCCSMEFCYHCAMLKLCMHPTLFWTLRVSFHGLHQSHRYFRLVQWASLGSTSDSSTCSRCSMDIQSWLHGITENKQFCQLVELLMTVWLKKHLICWIISFVSIDCWYAIAFFPVRITCKHWCFPPYSTVWDIKYIELNTCVHIVDSI